MYDTKQYDQFDNETKKLLEASIEAREKAYAPYSKFKVGAALLSSSGNIITGCNVENACYPLSTCAERTAIVKAVSDGHTDFISIAVSGAFDDNCGFVTPCGACRQNMCEFKDKKSDLVIYLVKPDRSLVLQTTLNNILPFSFSFIKDK